MKRIVYVQKSTVLNKAPSDIIAPLLGRMHGIAPLQPLGLGAHDEAKFMALIESARAVGLTILWWFTPGYYSFGHPEWVLRGGAANKKDWLDFRVPEARQKVADVTADMVNRMGYDGANLDYIRYGWWVLDDVPTASAEDITETVRLVRDSIPNKTLTAAVVKPELHPYYKVPMYERRGQMWPDWLAEDLMDWVQPMSYAEPETLAEWMALMPKDSRISPIISPGPTRRIDLLTLEQFRRNIELIKGRGWHFSIWDWKRVTPEYWAQVDLLGGGTVADITQDLRNEITELETTKTAIAGQLQARIENLIAIADRLDAVDAAAETVAEEL